MRLHQNEIWKKDDQYICIVELERLHVRYKTMKELTTREGEQHDVTKKEFCRLIKGAVLMSPAEIETAEQD